MIRRDPTLSRPAGRLVAVRGLGDATDTSARLASRRLPISSSSQEYFPDGSYKLVR